jgi:hypothetical protein
MHPIHSILIKEQSHKLTDGRNGFLEHATYSGASSLVCSFEALARCGMLLSLASQYYMELSITQLGDLIRPNSYSLPSIGPVFHQLRASPYFYKQLYQCERNGFFERY